MTHDELIGEKKRCSRNSVNLIVDISPNVSMFYPVLKRGCKLNE
jgi:hypothetical protein